MVWKTKKCRLAPVDALLLFTIWTFCWLSFVCLSNWVISIILPFRLLIHSSALFSLLFIVFRSLYLND